LHLNSPREGIWCLGPTQHRAAMLSRALMLVSCGSVGGFVSDAHSWLSYLHTQSSEVTQFKAHINALFGRISSGAPKQKYCGRKAALLRTASCLARWESNVRAGNV
jgi:hypothetical protein